MMTIQLTLRAATPLALRAGWERDEADTLAYIPGSTLLGALAGAHRLLFPKQDEQFNAFFLRDQVSYGNAYPASFRHGDLDVQCTLPVVPLPNSARSCKRFGGFRDDADAANTCHGASDHLLPWAVFALSGGEKIAPLKDVQECPQCFSPMDRFTGFYRQGGDSRLGKAKERRRLQTRTGISRLRGTVAEGILYQRQVLAQGSVFSTTIGVTPDLADSLAAFIEDAAQSGLLRVGTGRTRGLGRLGVTETIPLGEPADAGATIEGRIAAFNRDLRMLARTYSLSAPDYYVPITLTSDLLLPDALGRWRAQLDTETLAAAGLPGARLLHVAAGTRRLMGWNSLLGLPRPAAHAISMGSVFLFAFDQRPDFAALARLEQDGLGHRRAEGFGRLRVADTFHWKVNER